MFKCVLFYECHILFKIFLFYFRFWQRYLTSVSSSVNGGSLTFPLALIGKSISIKFNGIICAFNSTGLCISVSSLPDEKEYLIALHISEGQISIIRPLAKRSYSLINEQLYFSVFLTAKVFFFLN